MRFWLLLVALTLVVAGCKKADADIPEYGPIGEFTLRDQTGAEHASASWRGHTTVVAFMFTRCPTVCPVLTGRMKTLQAEAKAREVPLRLVSISVDPENDTPEVLAEYAKKNGADTASWSFLTGDYDVVKKTSVDGFKMALEGKADPNADDFGILHGSHLVLVDRELRIRGYYRSKDDAEMARLIEDAARLSR